MLVLCYGISYQCKVMLSLSVLPMFCEELEDHSARDVENARLNSLGEVAVSGKLYFCSKFALKICPI